MNLQQTYYFPVAANRPDLASTLVDYIVYVHALGSLNSNVPVAWRADSAAAPTGASSLNAAETCYWNYGSNCTTSPPSVTGNLLWTLQVVHLAAITTGNASIDVDVVFPVLDRALQFYVHFQVRCSSMFAFSVLMLPPPHRTDLMSFTVIWRASTSKLNVN